MLYKDKTVVIMQPTYFPWVGLFDLLDAADLMVWYDDVQLVKRSWDCRNRIKTSSGEVLLTVPVFKNESRDNTTFSSARINYEQSWSRKHLQALKLSYQKAPNFEAMHGVVTSILSTQYPTIGELNIVAIEAFAAALGITTPTIRSSTLEGVEGSKDIRLAAICKQLEATHYLSPLGSGAYMEASFPGGHVGTAGIEVHYQQYVHPTYNQQYGDFASHLSIVDLMYNHAFDEALRIIRSGRHEPIPCRDYHTYMEKRTR
jgi:hypothetical protein